MSSLPSSNHQTPSSNWTETALDWWHRSQHQHRLNHHITNGIYNDDNVDDGNYLEPRDPDSAAWSFCHGRTGMAYMDAVLQRPRTSVASSSHRPGGQSTTTIVPIVVDVRGDVGKTWTMISLAARFVVATRPSQFETSTHMNDDDDDDDNASLVPSLPHVFLLDSDLDVTLPKLTYAVRSTLLRKLATSSAASQAALNSSSEHQRQPVVIDEATLFANDMTDCLSRISLARLSHTDASGWIPILEVLRHDIQWHYKEHPVLLLWDGFLGDLGGGPQASRTRTEVVRQLERLLADCTNVTVVLTTPGQLASSSSYGHKDAAYSGSGGSGHRRDWERLVTHRIRLECRQSGNTNSSSSHNDDRHHDRSTTNAGTEYVATVQGAQIPFSISMAGILS